MLEDEETSVVEWEEGEEPEGDEEPGSFTFEDPEVEKILDAGPRLSEEEEALLPDDILRARAEAKKPVISHLRPAVVDGEFILKKSDYVVIERRRAHNERHEWLDTRVYRLVEDPKPNGDLKLVDPVRMQFALSNWKTGLELGFDFRLPPAGRNPETCLESGGKRRRKRKVQEDKPVATVTSSPDAPERRKGRGRPAGVKNRPKEVVQAEKLAKLEERRAKKAARVARKFAR